jgi:hypothetical protein
MKKETPMDLIGLALENKTEVSNNETPFEIGKAYFIRTVTYHLVGKVKRIVGNFVEFEEDTTSWIADSGRFNEAINEGKLNEVEPVKVIGGINLSSIVDYFEWVHKLPRDIK